MKKLNEIRLRLELKELNKIWLEWKQYVLLFIGFKVCSVYFASWAKSCAGIILSLVEHDWSKWSHDNMTQINNGLGFTVVVKV